MKIRWWEFWKWEKEMALAQERVKISVFNANSEADNNRKLREEIERLTAASQQHKFMLQREVDLSIAKDKEIERLNHLLTPKRDPPASRSKKS